MMVHISFGLLIGYPIVVVYGAAFLILGVAYIFTRSVRPVGVSLLGEITVPRCLYGLSAVVTCYTICYMWTSALALPREFVMKSLGFGMTPAQYCWLIISLMVLPPIVEELAYRHFLLAALPIERSRVIALIAVVATALLFGLSHTGYEYTPTKALMYALGLVLGWARWITGGLLLPICLHSMCTAIALGVDTIWKNWS